MTDKATYDRAVISLYDGELHAIDEMLTVVGVPTADENGTEWPTRGRVRWLIEEYVALLAPPDA